MSRRGIGGHQSAAANSETWLTPPDILEVLGPFDLDPCAAPLPRPFVTARHMVSLPDDGLSIDWFGRVWGNFPYGRKMAVWMRRMAAHGCGTALTFARTETEWFFEAVWRAPAVEAVLFLEGRLNFHYPDGRRSKYNAGGPSVLIAYGAEDADRLHDSGLSGRFVPLSRAGMIFVAFRSDQTWREVVLEAVRALGNVATLSDLYRAIERHPKAIGRRHWQAKVRQQVQADLFTRVQPGRYAIAEAVE